MSPAADVEVVEAAGAAYRTSLGPSFESSAVAYARGQALRLAGHPERALHTWLDSFGSPHARGWPVMMNAVVETALQVSAVQATVDRLAQHADRLPELHLWVGVLASRANDPVTAELAYGRAAATTSGELSFTATTERLRVLLALDRLDDALAAVTEAMDRLPQHQGALRTSRAGVLNRAGRSAEALLDVDQVLATHPDFAPAWLNRGSALVRLGRPTEARESLARAVSLDPTLVGPAAALAP